MGRKGKGPPYLNPPAEKYVVVINPWGVKTPSLRVQRDADIVGAWMRAVFDFEPGLIERIFMMGTRDEVIVEISSRANIVPGLGSHRWSEILEPCPAADSKKVSYIFEYNWRRHGDPGEHSWVEYFPRQDMPPPSFPVKGFPRKYPYPKASWAEPSNIDGRLSNLILRLPESRVRTPTPPPPEPEHVQTAPAVPHFAPYAPPAHHPSHTLSHFANPALNPSTSTDNEDIKPVIKAESQEVPLPPPVVQPEINSKPNGVLGKLGKADPYEEDEAAEMFLKKEEPTDSHVPSAALVALLGNSVQPPVPQAPIIKSEPQTAVIPLHSSHQPSSSLREVSSTYESSQTSVKHQVTPALSMRDPRLKRQLSANLEPTDNPSESMKRPKVEVKEEDEDIFRDVRVKQEYEH